MRKDAPSENEMRRERDRVQATAERILDAVAEAVCDPDRDRAAPYVEQAQSLLSELKSDMAKAPYLSVDLSEIERELRILSEAFKSGDFRPLLTEISPDAYRDYLNRHFKRHNYLGRAAEMRGRIVEAMSRDAFDEAWKLAHEVQNQYLLHAEREHFDRAQTLSLSASVQKITADILRRQGRHVEALRHYLYYSMHSASVSEAQVKRLRAYLNRSKLPSATLTAAMALLDKSDETDGFQEIDRAIEAWHASPK